MLYKKHAIASLILAFLLIFNLGSTQCLADSNLEKLLGTWRFQRADGSPCKELIIDLTYIFKNSGEYIVQSKMRSTGKSIKDQAAGTFKINDDTITTQVEGYTLGPMRFRFEDDYLVFEQTNPRCDLYLYLENK